MLFISTSVTWEKRRSIRNCRSCESSPRITLGIDPVYQPIPVRPVVHYMMGGIHTNIETATPVAGLFAAGECACVSINGANRLGSNSLTELLVFGARAGRAAAAFAKAQAKIDTPHWKPKRRMNKHGSARISLPKLMGRNALPPFALR